MCPRRFAALTSGARGVRDVHMADRFAFGIGSYHFAPEPGSVASLSWGTHFSNVASCLRAIGAEDVEWDYDSDLDTVKVPFQFDDVAYEDGGGVTPPSWARLHFALRIPATFQRRALAWREPTTEYYWIEQRYPYFSPVTFVFSSNDDDRDPSMGVNVVRQYLAERLDDISNLSFAFVGPSPFHADCYLAPREVPGSSEVGVVLRKAVGRGYADLRFLYDPTAQSGEEALDEVLRVAEEELSYYYGIVRADNGRYASWSKIDEMITQLIALHRGSGVRAYARKLRETQRLTRDGFIALAEFAAASIALEGSLSESFDELFERGNPKRDYFRDTVEDALRHRMAFPVSETDALLQRFETRMGQAFERVALVVGPVVGVLIGALIARI